jgi:mRNA-degrading endonuclease RelE of RelBE toxin-antitoxin system
MTWRIEVKPAAEKQYLRLDGATRGRIKKALRELARSEAPLLHPRVKPLTGKLKGDCQVRVGDWRILVTPDREAMLRHVYAILPRGCAY